MNMEDEMTKHRIYVEFEGGYFVTSLDPQFNAHLQDMVADLGPPTRVEFRAEDDGWYTEDDFVQAGINAREQQKASRMMKGTVTNPQWNPNDPLYW